jgi:alkyl hydroperoxide reductase subunit AhpF
MKLNTSSEMTALDTKAEGNERGEIRVDGGLRGEVDDKGGLASGVCVTAEARQILFSICVNPTNTYIFIIKRPRLHPQRRLERALTLW